MGKWRLRQRTAVESSEIVSLIGEGTVFTGDLVLKGGARIDGKVVGKSRRMRCSSSGRAGRSKPQELRAHRVTVCGSVRGKLIVQDRLEIQTGGRVSGHVVMEKEGLVVAPGGLFEGAVEYSRERRDPTSRAARVRASEATV